MPKIIADLILYGGLYSKHGTLSRKQPDLQTRFNLRHLSHDIPDPHLRCLPQWLIRPPGRQLALRAFNPGRLSSPHRRTRKLHRRNARLDRALRQRRLAMQRPRLLHVPRHPKLVHPDNALREHIPKRRYAARRASSESADQEIRLPAENRKLVRRKSRREARDLAHRRTRKLHADDIAAGLADNARDEFRVHVDAIADAGEVVEDDGQGRLGGDVEEEVLDHGGRGGFAEIGRRENQCVVGAGGRGVGDVLEHLGGGVGAAASHERV